MSGIASDAALPSPWRWKRGVARFAGPRHRKAEIRRCVGVEICGHFRLPTSNKKPHAAKSREIAWSVFKRLHLVKLNSGDTLMRSALR